MPDQNLDRVNWAPNERVDIPDAQAFVKKAARHVQAAVGEIFTRVSGHRIIRGFIVSVVDSNTIRITRGVAGSFVGSEDSSAAPYGQILDDTTTTTTVDIAFSAGDAVGTWNIGIKFTLSDGDSANRAFWDPGTAAEFVQLTPTRLKADWSATKSSGALSAEYVKIAEVDWQGGITAGHITDTRNTLFEGPIDEVESAAGLPDHDSRSTDRASNHLQDFASFRKAMLREIQDIKSNHWNRDGAASGHPWFKVLPGGLSLRSAQGVTVTVGDGSTTFGNYNANDPAYSGDAALAIQAAITRAESVSGGGGIVRIKPGTYLCKTSIVFSGVKTDLVRVEGHGPETLLLWDASTTPAPMFTSSPAENDTEIHLARLTLKYTNTGDTTSMVRVDLSGLSSETMAKVVFDDVHFLDTGGMVNTGVEVTGGSATETLQQLIFRGCHFEDLLNGAVSDWVAEQTLFLGCSSEGLSSRVAHLSNSTNVQVSACAFSGWPTKNTVLRFQPGCSKVQVTGSILDNCGLVADNITDLVVSGNIIEPTNPTVPIGMNRVNQALVTGNILRGNFLSMSVMGCDNTSVIDNILLCDKGHILIGASGAIPCVNVQITGNILSEETYGNGVAANGQYGIWATEMAMGSIEGNLMLRPGQTGVLMSYSHGVHVSRNTILDDDWRGGQNVADRITKSGILVNSTCTRVVVNSNIIHGLTETGIRLDAADSVLNGNLVTSIDGGVSDTGFDLGGAGITGSGNIVETITGSGFKLSADRIHLSECFVDTPTTHGFELLAVDDCHLIGCAVRSPGARGFDGAAIKSGLPVALIGCSVYQSVGESFSVVGVATLTGCSAYDPAGVAFQLGSGGVTVMSDCQVLLASGTAAVVVTGPHDINLSNCRITVDGSSLPTHGISVGQSNGSIKGVSILGNANMTGAGIVVANPSSLAVSDCWIDGYGDVGIEILGAGVTVSGCVVKGTSGAGAECLHLAGGSTATGCAFTPDSGETAILLPVSSGVPVVNGCQILGTPGVNQHIYLLNTNGAVISNNRAEEQANIELSGINNNITIGNRGFLLSGAGGSGNLPATFNTLNIEAV